jgi:hypothetical protein
LSPGDDPEKGLEVVAFVDGRGEPLGIPVNEGGTYALLDMLYMGMLVERVPLMGNDGVGVGKGAGDSEPDQPAFEIEPENGDEAVRYTVEIAVE